MEGVKNKNDCPTLRKKIIIPAMTTWKLLCCGDVDINNAVTFGCFVAEDQFKLNRRLYLTEF